MPSSPAGTAKPISSSTAPRGSGAKPWTSAK
jgi:hypothetical protein